MTLERGSRDDTTARSPVSARFVLSSFPPRLPSFLLERYAVSPSASSPPPPFSSPLLPSLALSSSFVRERRQVGIRAAVNSPAPLSALMSLLLFALLNAIRAYSVSLPPPLGTRATPRRPFDFLATHVGSRTEVRARARALAHTLTRILGRSSAAAFARSRAPLRHSQVRVEHARNTLTRKDVPVTRGIAPRGWRGA